MMGESCTLYSVRGSDEDGLGDEDAAAAGVPMFVLQRAPFTVQPITPLRDVHVMFTMLGCAVIYVADYGRLVGIIETKHLLAFERGGDMVGKQPEAKMMRVKGGVAQSTVAKKRKSSKQKASQKYVL